MTGGNVLGERSTDIGRTSEAVFQHLHSITGPGISQASVFIGLGSATMTRMDRQYYIKIKFCNPPTPLSPYTHMQRFLPGLPFNL